MGNWPIEDWDFYISEIYFTNIAFNNAGMVLNIQGFDGIISFSNNTVKNNLFLVNAIYPFNYNTSTMAGIDINDLLDTGNRAYLFASCYDYMLGGYSTTFHETDEQKAQALEKKTTIFI